MNFDDELLQYFPAAFQRGMKPAHLRDGTPIYHQGQILTNLFLIADGYVRLASVNRCGDEFTRAILGRGALFGVALNRRGSSMVTMSAYARGPVRLHAFSITELQKLVRQQPDLAWLLIERLSSIHDYMDRRVEDLRRRNVEARVAGLLHDLLEWHGVRCRHGHDRDIRLTQQDLADLVGASRPVVSGILKDLRDRGVVAYTRRFICADNLQALRELYDI